MAQKNPHGYVFSPEYNVLMQAITTSNGPAIQQILAGSPDLIHVKGWHGMTVLHRACLGGNFDVIHLLLRAGSDPNVPNNNGETSTHFACKRGNASVLHLVLEFGGDITAVDKQGRGAVHHAAESGSVCLLHYLHTVCNLGFQVVDSRLQTPFHIVCTYGHMDTLKYFLRKQRHDTMKMNIDGDTPLHILAREGHSHLCWLLLCETGCQALHTVNNAGYNPKDLAEQRDKIGHREITPVLQHFYNLSKYNRTIEVKGPVLLWYWFLLMPAGVYSLLIVLSHIVPPAFQGIIFLVGLFYIMFTQAKQLHRIQHVCRWPNPMYAGVFGAGLFHTFLAYFIIVFPYVSQYSVLLILSPLLLSILLYLYWKVLTIDPGVVKNSCYDNQLRRELTLLDLCQPPRKVEDFCIECEIVKPRLTKHCKLCRECYRDMDHHCLFLLRCVAGNNQIYFVWFICVCLLSMFIFVGISLFHCHNFYDRLPIHEMVGQLFLHDSWLLSLMIMNVLSMVWGVNLLRTQFAVIAEGLTNYFRPAGYESVLTAKEKMLNIVYFMLAKPPYVKNPQEEKVLNIHV
ncbi:hypothetical protein SNE40_005464 [Patella caerulea]|uniref:Palmitoyltransferase n=1 Tax=Patella caerulea TaxID=87958 RepID=A0AAN8K870_PATCE